VAQNNRSFEQALEDLVAGGLIEIDHFDERGRMIYVCTEMGRLACMTREECLALMQIAVDELIAVGLVRETGINEKGEKKYALTEAGLLQEEDKH
jgi:hypothetical protein